MSKGIHQLIGAVTFSLAVAASAPAFAVPVVGTSGGTFSNLSQNCGNECAITNSGTLLKWGSTSTRQALKDPSTLKADSLSINVSTDATNVAIAELSWSNSATLDNRTPDIFTVHYNLSIDFSQPNSTSTGKTFDLAIVNTLNPTGDYIGSFTLPDLNALVFDLTGVTVDNLHYAVDGHGKLVTDPKTGNIYWYNKEDKSSNLYILADFTADAVPPTPAPEPATLALLGAGLLGLGKMRRRSRKH